MFLKELCSVISPWKTLKSFPCSASFFCFFQGFLLKNAPCSKYSSAIHYNSSFYEDSFKPALDFFRNYCFQQIFKGFLQVFFQKIFREFIRNCSPWTSSVDKEHFQMNFLKIFYHYFYFFDDFLKKCVKKSLFQRTLEDPMKCSSS